MKKVIMVCNPGLSLASVAVAFLEREAVTVEAVDSLRSDLFYGEMIPNMPAEPWQLKCYDPAPMPCFDDHPDEVLLGKDNSFDRINRGPIRHRGKNKAHKRR